MKYVHGIFIVNFEHISHLVLVFLEHVIAGWISLVTGKADSGNGIMLVESLWGK